MFLEGMMDHIIIIIIIIIIISYPQTFSAYISPSMCETSSVNQPYKTAGIITVL